MVELNLQSNLFEVIPDISQMDFAMRPIGGENAASCGLVQRQIAAGRVNNAAIRPSNAQSERTAGSDALALRREGPKTCRWLPSITQSRSWLGNGSSRSSFLRALRVKEDAGFTRRARRCEEREGTAASHRSETGRSQTPCRHPSLPNRISFATVTAAL